MSNYSPSIVDYRSEAFSDGFDAGKNARPCTVPSRYAGAEVPRASWLEGWLMGDTERDDAPPA